MRREVTDLIGSALLLAALLTATLAVLAPTPGASTTSASVVAPAVLAERGRALFSAKGCPTCHRKAGESNMLEVGPDLTGLAARAGTRRQGMSAEAYVRESITSPSAFIVPGFEGRTMPDLGLSATEIETLTAFLLGDR